MVMEGQKQKSEYKTANDLLTSKNQTLSSPISDSGAMQTSQAYLYANTATDYDPAGNVMRQRHVTSRDSLKTHDLPVSLDALDSRSF